MKYVFSLAWIDWSYAVYSTLMFAPGDRIAMGIPTLGTQALLTLGLMLGSNAARASYIVWCVFWSVVHGSASSGPPAEMAWAEYYGAYLVTFLVILGLLLPQSNRWYAAVRSSHRNALHDAQLRRVQRNLCLAALWVFVWPLSLFVGMLFGTPALAVLAACVPGGLVFVTIVGRQWRKLFMLRRAEAGCR